MFLNHLNIEIKSLDEIKICFSGGKKSSYKHVSNIALIAFNSETPFSKIL